MKPIDFYQSHLNRVSRSFAYCISRLETPLRGWVSLTYLVCRILDTLEDAKWKKQSEQVASLSSFEDFVSDRNSLEKIDGWIASLPENLNDGERLLLLDAKKILHDLHSIPEEAKRSIQALLAAMSGGMKHFIAQKKNGILKLRAIKEVNQYCFFVAGIVGEALSQLLAVYDNKIKLHRELLINAHHFGLFLQKINLLKDQSGDEKEGRYLIPSREKVLESLKRNADGAFRFVQNIPVEHHGFRVFCLSSLFLGLSTVPVLANPQRLAGNKIGRNEAAALFRLIDEVVDQPSLVAEMYAELSGGLTSGESFSSEESANDPAQMPAVMESYSGPLDVADLVRLEIV